MYGGLPVQSGCALNADYGSGSLHLINIHTHARETAYGVGFCIVREILWVTSVASDDDDDDAVTRPVDDR